MHVTARLITAAAMVLGSAVLIVPPDAAAASAQCTYTPKLPAKLTVGQDVVGLRAGLSIVDAGVDCSASFSASISLVHSTDSYFLTWNDTSTTDAESVYAFEVVPGTYRTAGDGNCLADSADFSTSYTCSINPAATIIKFAGHARLIATRLTGVNSSKIRFTARALRFSGNGNIRVTDTVSIQRYSSGAWHTIHTATAKASSGYTWTYTHRTSAKYRAIATETSSAFRGTSATVTK